MSDLTGVTRSKDEVVVGGVGARDGAAIRVSFYTLGDGQGAVLVRPSDGSSGVVFDIDSLGSLIGVLDEARTILRIAQKACPTCGGWLVSRLFFEAPAKK